MELFLQFGHNMGSLSLDLIEKWGGGTVIFSPRDQSTTKMIGLSNKLDIVNGCRLVDPQFFDPRANHKELVKHSYWPVSYATEMLSEGIKMKEVFEEIRALNDLVLTTAYIIPGTYTTRITPIWIKLQGGFAQMSEGVLTGKQRYATFALAAEAITDTKGIELLINESQKWDIDGYYIVAEHPRGQYLIDDPIWLANLLILCASLKLQGRKVILGYGNHQMLALAAANVDAIASGHFLNVRSFSTDRFHSVEPSPSHRARWWYYCPQSLSEYSVQFLDVAYRMEVMDQLVVGKNDGGGFVKPLFSGALPSSTSFSERLAQRHYLDSLRQQALQATKSSFEKTIANQRMLLKTAEHYLEVLQQNGVRGRDRDFSNIIDVNRSALDVFEREMGFAMSMEWVGTGDV